MVERASRVRIRSNSVGMLNRPAAMDAACQTAAFQESSYDQGLNPAKENGVVI
jgi:hypothetical protein